MVDKPFFFFGEKKLSSANLKMCLYWSIILVGKLKDVYMNCFELWLLTNTQSLISYSTCEEKQVSVNLYFYCLFCESTGV